jgi:hypothetical protein
VDVSDIHGFLHTSVIWHFTHAFVVSHFNEKASRLIRAVLL